jgi:hypothetical protein
MGHGKCGLVMAKGKEIKEMRLGMVRKYTSTRADLMFPKMRKKQSSLFTRTEGSLLAIARL